ncbi:hypothetical protein BDV26DRAFT_303373 [Aspergillus bertholletiae]|uniref:Protein YTP1-like C-terminal domain-containing protein n=1 Tax=Aspergillus bertholletiae TaxID=1226010 RepID=A0A5N7BDF0_9EURO|nr:hypothetical protein BDV26DRAFT_303373 [Aspergillus bertholletiae]
MLIQSKWAPAGDALAAFVTLLGLWIYGGSGYLTYRIPQIVLTIVLLIQQSLGFYVYRKQKVYSEYVAQYLGYAHGIATVVLFALGWYHITAGSLEAVDIRQNYYNIFSHAIFLVIIMIEEIQLISSATGLWPRPGNRTPDYYDSVLILGGALFFFAILVSRYHPNSKGYDLVGRLEHIAYAVMVVCAAATSIMFSTGKRHQNKRNIMPALIVIVLGLLFTSHHQEAMLVKQIHQVFGYTMMVAASFRILEILVLPYWPVNASDVRISLRYMAPLVG